MKVNKTAIEMQPRSEEMKFISNECSLYPIYNTIDWVFASKLRFLKIKLLFHLCNLVVIKKTEGE